MKPTETVNQNKYCSSCGAPVTAEICAYCGTPTGLQTAEADMEYPVLTCREANINFWTLAFPAIFAASFGITGLVMLLIAASGFGNGMFFLIGAPFALIGITALFLALRTVFRYIMVKTRGEKIRAVVYGYMDDKVLINDRPAQIVKLLIRTPEGPGFILYQLGDTVKIYGIHDSIDVMMYGNYFLICRK